MFYVISKGMWRRGIVLTAAVALVASMYVVSWINEGGNAVQPESDQSRDVDVVDREMAEDPTDGEAVASIAASTTVAAGGPFAQYRLERMRGRSRRVEFIQTSLVDKTLNPDVRAQLVGELMHLIDMIEKEEDLEGLLAVRGLEDAIVYIGGDAAEIVVPTRISAIQAQRIGAMISRLGGVDLEQVTIADELIF